MRAEEDRFVGLARRVGGAERLRHVERVLHVAGRVIGGRVERVEAMPLRLDLGTVGDDEAQLAEGSENAFAGAGERMERTGGSVGAREGRVDGRAEGGGDLGVLDLGQQGGEQLFDGLLRLVDQLAHDRAFFLREGGHPLHHLGQGAIGADDARLEGFELGAGGDGGGFLGGGGDELGELLLHGLICALAEKVGKRKHLKTKKPRRAGAS